VFFSMIEKGDILSPQKTFSVATRSGGTQRYAANDRFTVELCEADKLITRNFAQRIVYIYVQDFEHFELFQVDSKVECREKALDGIAQWITGIVTSTAPLKVKFTGEWFPRSQSQFGTMRGRKGGLNVGEPVKYLNRRKKWRRGVVAGLYPYITVTNTSGCKFSRTLAQVRKIKKAKEQKSGNGIASYFNWFSGQSASVKADKPAKNGQVKKKWHRTENTQSFEASISNSQVDIANDDDDGYEEEDGYDEEDDGDYGDEDDGTYEEEDDGDYGDEDDGTYEEEDDAEYDEENYDEDYDEEGDETKEVKKKKKSKNEEDQSPTLLEEKREEFMCGMSLGTIGMYAAGLCLVIFIFCIFWFCFRKISIKIKCTSTGAHVPPKDTMFKFDINKSIFTYKYQGDEKDILQIDAGGVTPTKENTKVEADGFRCDVEEASEQQILFKCTNAEAEKKENEEEEQKKKKKKDYELAEKEKHEREKVNKLAEKNKQKATQNATGNDRKEQKVQADEKRKAVCDLLFDQVEKKMNKLQFETLEFNHELKKLYDEFDPKCHDYAEKLNSLDELRKKRSAEYINEKSIPQENNLAKDVHKSTEKNERNNDIDKVLVCDLLFDQVGKKMNELQFENPGFVNELAKLYTEFDANCHDYAEKLNSLEELRKKRSSEYVNYINECMLYIENKNIYTIDDANTIKTELDSKCSELAETKIAEYIEEFRKKVQCYQKKPCCWVCWIFNFFVLLGSAFGIYWQCMCKQNRDPFGGGSTIDVEKCCPCLQGSWWIVWIVATIVSLITWIIITCTMCQRKYCCACCHKKKDTAKSSTPDQNKEKSGENKSVKKSYVHKHSSVPTLWFDKSVIDCTNEIESEIAEMSGFGFNVYSYRSAMTGYDRMIAEFDDKDYCHDYSSIYDAMLAKSTYSNKNDYDYRENLSATVMSIAETGIGENAIAITVVAYGIIAVSRYVYDTYFQNQTQNIDTEFQRADHRDQE